MEAWATERDGERLIFNGVIATNCHTEAPLDVKMFLTARVELHKTVLTVDVELDTWWKSWSFITVWQMYAKTLNSTPLHQCVKSESFVRFIRPLQNATFDKRNLLT